ncbi:hypothetical protein OSTOST_11415, partial [Ostertagia ostertagi]
EQKKRVRSAAVIQIESDLVVTICGCVGFSKPMCDPYSRVAGSSRYPGDADFRFFRARNQPGKEHLHGGSSLWTGSSSYTVALLGDVVKKAKQLKEVDVGNNSTMFTVWERLECPVNDDVPDGSLGNKVCFIYRYMLQFCLFS